MNTQPDSPSSEDLEELEAEIEAEALAPARTESLDFENPLEDLFNDALKERKLRKAAPRSRTDASLRDALDGMAKKMREIYSNPANWKRTRGLLLIDKASKTVLGNYSEYINTAAEAQAGVSRPRKLVHEHSPIEINGQEEIEGFLGVELERRVRGVVWDKEQSLTAHILLDEVFCEAPDVALRVLTCLGSVVRAELAADTQLANGSGSLLLHLSAGTDIWNACSSDTKAVIRKGVL